MPTVAMVRNRVAGLSASTELQGTPRIIVDAFGGDHGPGPVVEGCVAAAREGHTVILVGHEDVVRAELSKYPDATSLAIEVIDATEVIGMDDHAAQAVRAKRGASMNVAMRALKDGRGDAVFSAGNSGAVMASALFTLGRLDGVRRPAIAAVVPLLTGRVVIVDAGANADCDADNLIQFAYMGSMYVERMFGVARPRVGLISNGEEPSKGNALVLATHPRLAESSLNFVGNIEGRELAAGHCDVAVCDGFTGNVVLKLAEGVSKLCFDLVRTAIRSRFHYKLAGAVLRPGLVKAGKVLDYAEYGGAPLVGVQGNVFIGHGSSKARAISSGVRTASVAVKANLIPSMQSAVVASGVAR